MEHEIRRGDQMIVNRNQSAKPGDAVVALVNGDYTVKDSIKILLDKWAKPTAKS